MKATAIMVLTSGGRPGDGARCRELGVNAYLTKPVCQAELLRTLLVVLNAYHAGRTARATALEVEHSVIALNRAMNGAVNGEGLGNFPAEFPPLPARNGGSFPSPSPFTAPFIALFKAMTLCSTSSAVALAVRPAWYAFNTTSSVLKSSACTPAS